MWIRVLEKSEMREMKRVRQTNGKKIMKPSKSKISIREKRFVQINA